MAVLVAVALPALMAMAGLAIDAGNIYLAHTELQAATDAGALAGSLQLPYDPDMDKGIVTAAARTMVGQNYDQARVDSIVAGTEVRSVCVHTSTTVDLMLMGAVGLANSTVTAKACAGFNNLEIVLAIDNSGSMKGTPITMTNLAAENLVNLVMPDGSAPAVKVGLTPFRGKVRLAENTDGYAAGCLNADGTPNPGLLPEYTAPEYRYPSWSSLNVDPTTCSSIPTMLPLSTDKQRILAAIYDQDALGAGSGTLISEGLKWGRHMLTPEAPFTQADSNDRMRKILILLTDGDTEDGKCGGSYAVYYTPNNYWTNAYYGMGDMASHCEDGGVLNQAMLDEAATAKAAGIEIFSIRYGVSDSVDIDLMKRVASSRPGTDDHYFDAPSAYDIDDVFKKIGKQLGWRLIN
ncbi:MAG: pilus assembly protein TadG-related protein [Desulfovibrionaceae bacterium]